MNRIFRKMWRQAAVLGLLAAIALVALLPVSARADGEMGLDVRHGRGGEGDPLDTNDAGGNPGPGDEIQDTNGLSGGSLFGLDLWSVRIVLVPQYNGAAITFKVIVVSDARELLGGAHAK